MRWHTGLSPRPGGTSTNACLSPAGKPKDHDVPENGPDSFESSESLLQSWTSQSSLLDVQRVPSFESFEDECSQSLCLSKPTMSFKDYIQERSDPVEQGKPVIPAAVLAGFTGEPAAQGSRGSRACAPAGPHVGQHLRVCSTVCPWLGPTAAGIVSGVGGSPQAAPTPGLFPACEPSVLPDSAPKISRNANRDGEGQPARPKAAVRCLPLPLQASCSHFSGLSLSRLGAVET